MTRKNKMLTLDDLTRKWTNRTKVVIASRELLWERATLKENIVQNERSTLRNDGVTGCLFTEINLVTIGRYERRNSVTNSKQLSLRINLLQSL